MASANFNAIDAAIQNRQVMAARYHNKSRIFQPFVLGHKDLDELVSALQVGGSVTSPEWKCFRVDELRDLAVTEGEWRKPNDYSLEGQKCVREVHRAVPS